MIAREILVSSDAHEVRVALVEEGRLAEYLVERDHHRRLIGNVYQGRVTAIVPGMEAAFVDIGLPKNAFLYVDDIGRFDPFDSDDREAFDVDSTEEGEESVLSENGRPDVVISDLIKEGQDILVQVYKAPIGRKGCRVTTNISLPGRDLVLLPTTNRIGVSRKIEDEELREELREKVRGVVEEPMGAIVRTVAQDADVEHLRRDFELLKATWERIQEQAQTTRAPQLIHEDRGLIYRLVRDIFCEDVTQVLVDSEDTFHKTVSFARSLAPSIVGRIQRYEGAVPLFVHRGLETEISGLLTRRIWLPCGGYIVVEATEAFTSIDVNTGRYVGSHDLEETVYRANLEAAVEIGRQLRLRDIGGIVVIDFIDMREQEHRDALVTRFRGALARDRSRCQIYDLTPLGLMQVTRRRLHPSLAKMITATCPTCQGSGRVISISTVVIRGLRIAERLARENGGDIDLSTHPDVATQLTEEYHEDIRRIEEEYGCSIRILPDAGLALEEIVEDLR